MLLELTRDEESLELNDGDNDNDNDGDGKNLMESSLLTDDIENSVQSPPTEDNESQLVQTKQQEVLQLSTDDEFCSFVDHEDDHEDNNLVLVEKKDGREVATAEYPQQSSASSESTIQKADIVIQNNKNNEEFVFDAREDGDDDAEDQIEILSSDDEDGNVGDDNKVSNDSSASDDDSYLTDEESDVSDEGNASDGGSVSDSRNVSDIHSNDEAIDKEDVQESLERSESQCYDVVEDKDDEDKDGTPSNDSSKTQSSVQFIEDKDVTKTIQEKSSVDLAHENVQEPMEDNSEEIIATSYSDEDVIHDGDFVLEQYDDDEDVIKVDGPHVKHGDTAEDLLVQEGDQNEKLETEVGFFPQKDAHKTDGKNFVSQAVEPESDEGLKTPSNTIEIAETEIIVRQIKEDLQSADGVATDAEDAGILYDDDVQVAGKDHILEAAESSTSNANVDQEDFEMIDTFSERGSNYGDKPNLLFVDEVSIPISGTFTENEGFSEEDPMLEIVELTASNAQPNLLEQGLLGDTFMTTKTTSISKDTTSTATTAPQRSRRSKTPTRLGLPERQMVTRASTKKVTGDSNLYEDSLVSVEGKESQLSMEIVPESSSTDSENEPTRVSTRGKKNYSKTTVEVSDYLQQPMDVAFNTVDNESMNNSSQKNVELSLRRNKKSRKTVKEESIEEKVAICTSKRGKKSVQKSSVESEVVSKIIPTRRSSPRRKINVQLEKESQELEQPTTHPSTPGRKSTRNLIVPNLPESARRSSPRKIKIAEENIIEAEVDSKTDELKEVDGLDESNSRASTRGRKSTRKTIASTQAEAIPSTSDHREDTGEKPTSEIEGVEKTIPSRMSPRRGNGMNGTSKTKNQTEVRTEEGKVRSSTRGRKSSRKTILSTESEAITHGSSSHKTNDEVETIAESVKVSRRAASRKKSNSDHETDQEMISNSTENSEKEEEKKPRQKVEELSDSKPEPRTPTRGRKKTKETVKKAQEKIMGSASSVMESSDQGATETEETISRTSTRGRKNTRKITESEKHLSLSQEPNEDTIVETKTVPRRGSPRRKNKEKQTIEEPEIVEETFSESEAIDKKSSRGEKNVKKGTVTPEPNKLPIPPQEAETSEKSTRRASPRRKNIEREQISEAEPIQKTSYTPTRGKKNTQETTKETETLSNIGAHTATRGKKNEQETTEETEALLKVGSRTPTRGKKNPNPPETTEETEVIPKVVSRTPTRGNKNKGETTEGTEVLLKVASRTSTRRKKNPSETTEEVPISSHRASPRAKKNIQEAIESAEIQPTLTTSAKNTRGRPRKKTTSSNEPLILNTLQVTVDEEQSKQTTLTSLIQRSMELSTEDTVATRTRRKSGARQEVNRDLPETSLGVVSKTETLKAVEK